MIPTEGKTPDQITEEAMKHLKDKGFVNESGYTEDDDREETLIKAIESLKETQEQE